MRDFSKVSPSVWRSRKFKALDSDDARLAYLYILTAPHATSAGCYDLPEGYACSDLGWEMIRYRKAIDSLKSVGLIEASENENTLWIVNWSTFNPPTNAKHALGILSALKAASCEALKRKACEEFRQVLEEKGFIKDKTLSNAIDTLFKAYRKAIPTKTETETKTETRQRPDKDKDLDLDARECAPAERGVSPRGDAATAAVENTKPAASVAALSSWQERFNSITDEDAMQALRGRAN